MHPHDSATRKRRRPPLACGECRRRKIRCDRKSPCVHCTRFNRVCAYAAGTPKKVPQHDRTIDLTTPRSQTPSLPPPYVKNKTAVAVSFDAPHSHASPGSSTDVQDGTSQSSLLVRALSARVRELEEKLNQTSSPSSGDRSSQLAAVPSEPSPINGTFFKRRFFGNSQRSICEYKFRPLFARLLRSGCPESVEVHELLHQCKRLGRTVKAQEVFHQPVFTDLREYVPPRQTSDQLVQAYLRTMESVYRIVHVPSLLRAYEQYWVDSSAASPGFIITLLLIMAIGSVFCLEQNQNGLPVSRAAASHWIYTAQTWLSSPFEKSRLDIDTLQLHCLLLIARQTNAVGSDLVWLAAGTLLRTAMHMGLHIDPRHMPDMPPFKAEMRRRLWATVLEINLQTSMDAGGVPLISCDDYDCEPPMNIDDEQMENPTPQSTETFTETSLQIALLRSVPVRLQIARFTNDFRSGTAYDEALRMSADLTAIYRQNSTLFRTFHQSVSHPTPFQARFFDLMTQRFLLSLHDPFTIRAKSNPMYCYSRQIGLQTSLQILSPFTTDVPDAEIDQDYKSLLLLGAALYRDVTIQAICTVADEGLSNLEEKSSSLTALGPSPSLDPHLLAVRAIVERYTVYSMGRIRAGETNMKGYLMAVFFLAHIDARTNDVPIDPAVYGATRSALKTCIGLLEDMVEKSTRGSDPDIPSVNIEDTTESFSPNDWLATDELDLDVNYWLAMHGMI
ncbi:hypothetical protein BO70DRAFT_384522 [Aspergillus heteromorphus CBS 117.55]|uniref:Zn(2)-C6 fungal-type domain-containing protein n=1 Tax=Aspergillus heteromorphus CBS 117.55 TaxID=1448321 RepID=A0A317X1S7_9EURO|nr:uncharacterized protein BO70DRAFT_384522 [Aspergillus heteromorphus CBS 117.55]PWY90928.1 hypothetical protein BO70DRAFT_384522 [Aspergillus heteromorphus CBS 117.55]